MMLVTERETASKRRTSPLNCELAEGGAAGGVEAKRCCGRGEGRRVGKIAVLGRWREGTDGCEGVRRGRQGEKKERTLRIRTSLDLVEELHVADIVEVDPLLQHNDEPPSVELDGKDGGGESELADGGLPLQKIKSSMRGEQ